MRGREDEYFDSWVNFFKCNGKKGISKRKI